MPDVVLPVLNEQEAIGWVLERMPSGFRPIVVDNGSTDRSAEIAEAMGARVVREERRGFGAACYRGLLEATDDLICFMDCDGSLDPRLLVAVSDEVGSGRADLCMGSRVADPRAWPLHAKMANRYLARRMRKMLGIDVTDLGPMRAIRREALVGLQLADRRSGWPLEMVIAAARAGLVISEVPVRYRARSGRSKVTGTLAGTLTAIKDMAEVMR